MSKTLRVALVGLMLWVRSTSAGETFPNATVAPSGGDRFIRLMSDEALPASECNALGLGSRATTNCAPTGPMPVAPVVVAPQAPANDLAAVMVRLPRPAAESIDSTIGQTTTAQPPLLGNTVGTTPFAASPGMPLWNSNIQLMAQQSTAGQQPSVVYVPQRPAPPAPPRSADASTSGNDPSAATAVTEEPVYEPVPIEAQRFDKWIGSNYYQNGPSGGGGCTYNPHYVRGEYLLWWFTGDKLPPLVTTSPNGTPIADAGVLGQPGTSVLFGNQSANTSGRSGARITLGYWLNPSARGELEWFGLGGNNTSFNQSASNSTLAVPFYDLAVWSPAAYLLAYPGLTTGAISVRENSFFNGAGLTFLRDIMSSGDGDSMQRFGAVVGFRYLGLYEKLSIDGTSSLGGGSFVSDAFRTTNSFYGGTFGLYSERQSGRWTWDTIGRLGIGTTSQHATISGTSSPQWTTYPGGLFAMPSNMGSYIHDVFGLVPQLELKLAYAITPNLKLRIGYDLMYWNRVARPGEQIDTSVNLTQLTGTTVGTPGPRFRFQESDLLIQGVSTGMELRY